MNKALEPASCGPRREGPPGGGAGGGWTSEPVPWARRVEPLLADLQGDLRGLRRGQRRTGAPTGPSCADAARDGVREGARPGLGAAGPGGWLVRPSLAGQEEMGGLDCPPWELGGRPAFRGALWARRSGGRRVCVVSGSQWAASCEPRCPSPGPRATPPRPPRSPCAPGRAASHCPPLPAWGSQWSKVALES